MKADALRMVPRTMALGLAMVTGLFSFAAESTRSCRAATPHRYPDQHIGYPRQIAEAARKIQPKVVFLGDSITRHWYDTGREQWKKYLENETYRPANLGVSGDRTDEVLWRIDDGCLDGYEAKCIVLMIGTNNTGHFKVEDESPDDTASGVAAILERIRSKQPGAKIVLCAIFPRGATAEDIQRRRNETVNRKISSFADGKYVFWLDFNEQFLTFDGELIREIAPDLLHPGPYGYELWYAALKPYLDYAVAGGRLSAPPNRYGTHVRKGYSVDKDIVPPARFADGECPR